MFKLKETQTTLGPRCLEKQGKGKEQKGSKGLQEAKSEQGTNTQGAEGLSKSL